MSSMDLGDSPVIFEHSPAARNTPMIIPNRLNPPVVKLNQLIKGMSVPPGRFSRQKSSLETHAPIPIPRTDRSCPVPFFVPDALQRMITAAVAAKVPIIQ